MKKTVGIFFLFLLLTGCGKPAYQALNHELETNMKDADFHDFIQDVSLETKEKSEMHSYDYATNVVVKVDSSFDDVDTKEKLEMMGHFFRNYLQGKDVECGMPSCNIQGLVLQTQEKEYALVPDRNNYESFPSLVTNGTDTYSWNQLREDNGRIQEEKKKAEDKEETETYGASSDEVYAYMKAAYNELTNDGADYVPEIHDPMVARMAAIRFGITEQTAGDIYIEKEMGD